jgi:hypothetical protein
MALAGWKTQAPPERWIRRPHMDFSVSLGTYLRMRRYVQPNSRQIPTGMSDLPDLVSPQAMWLGQVSSS